MLAIVSGISEHIVSWVAIAKSAGAGRICESESAMMRRGTWSVLGVCSDVVRCSMKSIHYVERGHGDNFPRFEVMLCISPSGNRVYVKGTEARRRGETPSKISPLVSLKNIIGSRQFVGGSARKSPINGNAMM